MTKNLLLFSRGTHWAGRCLAWLFLLARPSRLLLLLALLLGPVGAWAQTTQFSETFEGTNSFTVLNGIQTNLWVVGTAAANGPTTTGTKAAYISNDGGTTNAYTTSSATSVVHMYKDVVFPAGQTSFNLSFDWKGQGENTFDYMQVFVVPTTTTPVAGTQLIAGQVGSTYYQLQAAYTRSTIALPPSLAGTTQRLVFSWRNDGSGGVQPPTALDNVLLTSATIVPVCSTPGTPKTVGTGGTYATLTAALNDVNTNGLCGPLVLELLSGYTSAAETFPLVYTNTANASSTNTVTIRPASGANNLSITSANTTATFSINGGKYLVIDGRPGGSGSPVSGAVQATDLIIANTAAGAAGSPVLVTNDAQNNTLQHCQVKGAGTSASGSPDILFSTGTTAGGNSNNTIQFNNVGGISSTSTPAALIYSSSATNATNVVASNNLFDFYGTGTAYGIFLSTAGNGWTISGNSFYQTASRVGVSATLYGINIGSGNSHSISGNFIGGTAASAGGTPLTISSSSLASRFVGILLNGAGTIASNTATSVQGNTIANFAWASNSGASAAPGVWGGIYAQTDANIGTTAGNTIGTSTGGVTVTVVTNSGSVSYGIVSSTAPTTLNIAKNTISNLTGAGAAGIAVSFTGIFTGGGTTTTNNITQNKIYNLTSANAAAVTTGIQANTGLTTNISNNLIGDLKAPASTSLVAVAGINIGSTTASNTANVYYNTINLAATGGATFGTSGIYLSNTTGTLDLRNNIVVNKSTPAGTGGATVALRIVSGTAGTAPATTVLANSTNNNLYYAGAFSATRLVYVEGSTTQTNPQQTLAAYKAFIAAGTASTAATREAYSVTEDVTFASTTGTSATFLHLSGTTQAESGGQPVNGITTDYDGDARNTSFPDIGADEGNFTPNDQTGPVISTLAFTSTAGSTTSRTLTASISDPSGVATGVNAPRLYYRKGTTGAFVFGNPTGVSGSTYTFTFDYSQVGAVAAGDVINYYLAAQDVLGNASTNPTNGAGATPPGTTPPPLFFSFTIPVTLSGTYYVAATSATAATSPVPARTYTTLTAAVNAYNAAALGGAVTFLLIDPTYSTGETFPISINNNGDASATNTLLIKPSNATGTTSFAITGTSGTTAVGLLQLIASDYVTLDGSLGNTISATDLRPSRDLTVTNTSTTATTAVIKQFATFTNDGATFNTIKNLVAVGTTTATTAATLYGVQLQGTSNATTANQYTNNTVQNVAVRGAQVGIASLGGAIGLKNQNVVITQNDLNTTGTQALTRGGILATFDNNGQYTLNNIDGITSASDDFGISLGFTVGSLSNTTFTGSEVTNATVSRNRIGTVVNTGGNSAVGIAAATATSGTNTLVNNFVSGVLGNGTSPDFSAGIYVNGSAGGGATRVLYNSASMTGTTTGATTPNFALAIGGSSPTVEIRNNVLYNAASTGNASYAIGFAYAGTTGSYAGLTSTNNAFFGATAVGLTGALGTTGTVRSTLADLFAETGQDRPTTATPAGTSLALGSSPFTSATDLHVSSGTGLALNNAGTPIAGITTDFDGDARDASTPDIGGDEFAPQTLDLKPVALLAPSAAQTCFGNAEPVTVQIQNNAASSVDFSMNNAAVTVVMTPPSGPTQTFTTTLASGSLGAGLTQNVTFTTGGTANNGTLDMTALGTYSFAVTATVAGDGNTANDNITATRTNAAPQAALPYLEQFNTSATPANFTLSGGFATSTAANNGSPASSYGLRVNIYGSNTTASATTPILGTTTSSNNVLTFDGRFLVFGSTAGYALTGTDRVDVQVAICGGAFATVYTINSTNYNGTGTTSGSFYTYNVPLTGVGSGQKVQVRLVATYGSTSGDFYVDVDNINVRSVFSTDLTPTALLAPSATQGCYGAAETVTVTVKNQGTTALDFTANPATVTVNVTGATTATLTGGIATGTLAPGATQDVTLTPTLNMSTAGTYTFAINATVTGDQNTANDNLTATRTATAPVAGTLAPGSTTLCNSGTATLTLTGSANGSIQYQQSSSATGPFTNVATGGTTATYTTPVLTQTTYYRAQTTCGTNVATSNVATVTVNTPLIASTNSPQTICSGSTATVTANGSSGTTVRFFAASAGGTALATGTAGAATASYTTPALTANTTYYAEAFTGGTEVVGKTAPNTTGTLSSGGLVFNVTGATMLKTVTVYSVGASGTVSIQLQNAAGTVLQTGTGAVAAGTTAAPVASVITLNFNLVAGTGYKLIQGGGTAINLVRDDNTTGNNTYPYTSPSGKVSITDGTLSGYYYSFYNWQLSTECASATRTPVQVIVNPQPTATASNNGPVCAGSTATVSFALTGTGPWNLTYSDGTTSTPVTGITTSPYTFTTGALSASTTYTVTALSDANCTATASPVASTIVTVRPLPTFSTTQTNVGCFGSSTGSITVTAAGGTAPYEYSINNGVTYTASATNPYTFTGLAAGTYQVLVKGQFCTAATAQAVTISQPASALSVTAAATDASSSTANDGSVTASASGGTSGYQYSLDATTYQPTGVFSNLAPGMYAVTAKDANGCTAQSTTVTVGTAASVCTTTTYTGAAPNDGSNWFNAANWTACVPTRTVDATIPGGLANYPALTTQATAEVRTLTIASGGSLAQSAGILAVYGNLSNSGTTTLTGGMVSLRGSSPTVTGVSTFYALEVDLSGGTMALSNATSISSGLTMKTGVLSTSSFTLTLLTGSLLSETESSYLLGTVIVPDRTLTAGTAESFSGIGLVLTPAVGSVSPGLTPVVRTTGTALTGAGSSVSITRYFDIQPATNTGLNVDMVFSYFTHEQNGIPTGSLALFKSVTTTSGPWANQSPITAGIKTISKAGITDFSIWTLGNLGAPLPVELTRFEATRAGSDAALAWSTATEKNSRGFEVQVSTDGRSYRVLSFVASPTAASTSPREYAYLDREASKAGLRYYRLRQLDLDGTATFSPVRTLRFEGKDARSFTAAPNPFRERLTLTVELPAGLVAAPALLSLTDAAGRSLLTQRTPALPAGTSQLELPDLAPLASGVYFVHLAVPGQPVQHLKVVKE